MNSWKRVALRGALASVLVVSLAGCGDDGGGSGGSDSPKASDSAIADAKKTVESFTAPLDHLADDTALTKKPTGVKVAYLENDQAVTHALASGFKEAAPLLGLDVTFIDSGVSTDAASTAWDQAVAGSPDVVVQTGWPRAIFEKQLKTLTDGGGHLVVDAIGEDGAAPDGIAANTYTLADATLMGKVIADYAVVATDGAPNVLVPFAPDFKVSQATLDGIKNRIKELCADCKVTELPVKAADIGTKSPQDIVSALQRDPGINVMIPTFDGLFTGVSSAMKAAGLERDIKVVSTGGGPMIFSAIKNGEADAVLARPDNWFGWQLADTVARVATGQAVELPATFGGFNFPVQLITKDAVTFDPNATWDPWPEYKDAYKKAWGAS